MNALVALQQRVLSVRGGVLTALQIILGSVFLAIAANVAIPLPFTVVPISLQDTVAVFLGILLGPKKGALAVLAYLAEGACGLPVFANGHGGILCLFGPTGGYLIGFVPAAFIGGWLAQRLATHSWGRLAALLIGHVPVYLLGLPVLALYVGWNNVLMAGLIPFLPGELIKSFALAKFVKRQELQG